MQNTDKNKDKNQNTKKTSLFKSISDRLRDKDEFEVRSRLRFCVDFALCATISFLLGGAELPFSTYPLCIVLLCSSRKRLLPALLGLFVLAITGGLPDVFIFGAIATPMIRILLTYMPAVWSETRELPISHVTAVTKYDPTLPDKADPRVASNSADQVFGAALLLNEKLSLRA